MDERAHPRSRGEHGEPGNAEQEEKGSSPLARGTHLALQVAEDSGGLIPARAGNTTKRCACSLMSWAHPRSRGEHIDLPPGAYTARGSSPLARGTPIMLMMTSCTTGLIPARAGNTHKNRAATQLSRAHPRSRGEHIVSSVRYRMPTGSSPLARGTRGRSTRAAYPAGLIPARAGNTITFSMRCAPSGAHPRSRGEHPKFVFR